MGDHAFESQVRSLFSRFFPHFFGWGGWDAVVVVVIAVVLTSTHRYHAVRGHMTGSHNLTLERKITAGGKQIITQYNI